ncbi:MAG: hypothetical protein ABJN65_01220 [Parasphingorhabdus sp.]
MAFETVETWQVKRRLGLPFLSLNWSPQISADIPFREQLEKAPSAVLAIGLNSAFLYFLVTSAFDLEWEKPVDPSTTLEATMTMVDMGSSNKETELQPQQGGTGSPTIAPSPTSDLDATIETELLPEWSVGRILVAQLESPAPDVSAGAGTTQGSGVGTGSSKGVYDPYAGASPNRDPEKGKDRGARRNEYGASNFVEGIDQDAFDNWVKQLRKRLPRARGSIELSISVGNKGVIKSAKLIGGSASPQVKLFVRNAVVGRKLTEKKTGELVLPRIQLG